MPATNAPTLGPVDTVLAKLQGVKRVQRGWLARCPAHDDRSPSLSIGQGKDGRCLLHCHAGCTPQAITAAVGLTVGDLFPPSGAGDIVPPAVHPQGYRLPHEQPAGKVAPPATAPREAAPQRPADKPADKPSDKAPRKIVATYDYVDADGELVFQVVRFEPKDFRQRKPDGQGGWVWSLGETEPVLYHLPDVIEAIASERPVLIVEGEKDAETLRELGYVATTAPMGAGKWRESYASVLAGAHVLILPDADDVGRAHAEQIAASCAARDCVVRVVTLPDLPPKGDVTDWLDQGHTLDELDAVIGATPRWRPAAERDRRPSRYRLDELWEDEAIMRAPTAVVPRFAWAARSTLLASAEKAGKSTLCGMMAACVSRGAVFLDGDDACVRGPVLIVGLEEFLGDAARRLRQFGADPRMVYLVDHLPPDPRERPAALRAHVDAVKPALVIVDTLMAYAEGLISDAASSSQMQPVVQALTRLAHESESEPAVILVHHARKADGKYRDSSAIGGAVDVIVEVFAPEPDTDPTLREFRGRGRVPTSFGRMHFDGDRYHLVAGREAPLETRIVDYVRANPNASHVAIRRAVGGRAADIDLAIHQLLHAGRLADYGSGDRRAYRVTLAAASGAQAPDRRAPAPPFNRAS